MSKDINCPYCGHEQNIIHDDGYGYMEDEVYNQECCECKKTFIYTTFIFFDYDVKKADCLNDGKHEYYPTNTHPKCMTRMRCKHCAGERQPTAEERKIYGIGTIEDYLKEIEK
jgi:hypothetical protein